MPQAGHLGEINNFQLLLQMLQDNLEWPLEDYHLDDLTFTYDPEELGLKEEDAVKVRSIRQLRPLVDGQPWGIFFVEFEKKKLPVVLLRRILSHLVLKKRESANSADRKRWHSKDLLFVSSFGAGSEAERELAFAHFKETQGDLPTLNVLGWDGGDTKLKLDYVQHQLEAHLHWPDDTSDVEAWRREWSVPFRHGVRHTISTADALAEALAELARRIRDAASALMKVESEKGSLRKMHKAFKTALIHDLTEEGFADTYAQTITYGLLTAAISRTDVSVKGHKPNLIADNVADMVPITNPFLKEMLQTFLKAGGRKGGIDFDELGVQEVVELLRSDDTDLPEVIRDFGNRTGGEDPVIHFYEHFLAKYNKKLKVERGVFYTPKPVVGFIVRSVDELLRTEFGIEDGLASTITWREMAARNSELKIPAGTEPDSPFVVVLDPATGTATFLVEVIDLVHKRLEAKWMQSGLKAMPKLPATDFQRRVETFQDYWNSYVALSLLRRLHGYELMMAPYAIAHMKIGLKLAETKYRFGTEERARVYLTNALEPPDDRVQLTIADWASALAHEAEAVNRVKREQRFTVLIGNPPYAGISSNLTPELRKIVDPYRYIDGVKIKERSMLQFEKNIQDDYIKFWALTQRVLRGAEGVVGMITNHSFYDGPTLRGVRWNLLHDFQFVRLLNLHGHANKSETIDDDIVDENVFDIIQGVAISIMAKHTSLGATASIGDVWGTRQSKYDWLNSPVDGTEEVRLIPEEPYYNFVKPLNDGFDSEWKAAPQVNEVFAKYSTGTESGFDELLVAFNASELEEKLSYFSSARASEVREHFGIDEGHAEKLLRSRDNIEWGDAQHYKAFQLRAFDYREAYLRKDLLKTNSFGVMLDLSREHPGLVTTRQTKEAFTALAVASFCGHKCTSGYDRSYVFPQISTPRSGFHLEPASCIAPSVLRHFRSLGGFAPLDDLSLSSLVFNYSLALLNSPTYAKRYGVRLKRDWPRLPMPATEVLAAALNILGRELASVQMLVQDVPSKRPITLIGASAPLVESVFWNDSTVWLNSARTVGFGGVPNIVWEKRIGGHQVCERWLKDRKDRTLTAEDIAHYQKIVVALSETIRIQKEIDEVIEQHGGWPGAFATNAPVASEASEPLAQPKAKKPKAAKDPEPEDGPGYIPDPGEIPFG